MINNRQGGRRRGRGGQRTQSPSGRPDGNRQDNRQRGNAAQLLEKYKSMARDAQLGGDRVQTEYYLQFADHYFRMLSESRARFEDQRRQRGDESDDEESDEEAMEGADDNQPAQGRDDDQRFDRASGRDRGDRGENRDRPRRYGREERYAEDGPERTNGSGPQLGADDSIPFDALPPAIGRSEPVDDPVDEEEAAPPRRRARRPRPVDDGDVAPAA